MEPKQKQMVSPFAPRHLARRNKYDSLAPSNQVMYRKNSGAVHCALFHAVLLCVITYPDETATGLKVSKYRCLNLDSSDATHFWPFESSNFLRS